MGFVKPPGIQQAAASPYLFVANCGPALGLELSAIQCFFQQFGRLAGPVQHADGSGCRVIVSFCDPAHAEAARDSLHGLPCPPLGNRVLHVSYSHLAPPRPKLVSQIKDSSPVFVDASGISIPGLFLLKDFVSEDQEQGLLAAVDERPWQILAKRRVQHYGYEFHYKTRNVDHRQKLGELPVFVSTIAQKISQLSEIVNSAETAVPLDQLTVNDYPPGVGLSPHIDTHSAFVGAIISLSLAGPCVMEFRKYATDIEMRPHGEDNELSLVKDTRTNMKNRCDGTVNDQKRRLPIECKSIFLPERSLLMLLDEARYRWHHYIPHHKVEHVSGQKIPRCRRVSFTFRKVREGPCRCSFGKFCDSQALN